MYLVSIYFDEKRPVEFRDTSLRLQKEAEIHL